MLVATPKFPTDLRTSPKSFTPTPRPTPMMGPISGEISMAPMITAVELTFNPMDAMTMLKTKSKR